MARSAAESRPPSAEGMEPIPSVLHQLPVSLFLSTHPHIAPLALPLLSSCRCHANFPGDSVVMDTGRRGRSADVWCRSDMWTKRSPVCVLFVIPVSYLFYIFYSLVDHVFSPPTPPPPAALVSLDGRCVHVQPILNQRVEGGTKTFLNLNLCKTPSAGSVEGDEA